MERWTLSVGLWICVGLALYLCRRRSPLAPIVLALGATLLVGSFFPIASTFVTPISWRNLGSISEESTLSAQAQYLAFAVGMLVAVLAASSAGWLKPALPREEPSARSRVGQRDLLIASGLVLIGAPLYLAYVMRVGFAVLTDRYDFGLKYLAGAGLGPLAFGLPIMIAGCLWAEGGAVSKRARMGFRLIGLAIVVWSLAFISVRTHFAVLLLGSIAIHCARRGFQLARVRPSLVAGLLCAYVLLEGFSMFRGAYKGDLLEALAQIESRGATTVAAVVGGSELAHPFITACEVIESERAGDFAGRTLVDAVLAFVPTSLVPDRPPAPSEWFAREHYSAFAQRGGGTGFSLVAEGWLDLGSLLGPFGFGLVIAGLLGWLEAQRSRAPHSLCVRLEPFLLFLVVIGHRSDVASLLKQVVTIGLVAVVVWACAELVQAFLAPRLPLRATTSGEGI